MFKDKIHDGMGFRIFEPLNVALLMKQLWRICKFQELLISRTLKAKYFLLSDLFETKARVTDSFVWKSICSVLQFSKVNAREALRIRACCYGMPLIQGNTL